MFIKKEYNDIIAKMINDNDYDYNSFVASCMAKPIYPLSFVGWTQSLGMCLYIMHNLNDRSFDEAIVEIHNRFEKPLAQPSGKPCCGGGTVK